MRPYSTRRVNGYYCVVGSVRCVRKTSKQLLLLFLLLCRSAMSEETVVKTVVVVMSAGGCVGRYGGMRISSIGVAVAAAAVGVAIVTPVILLAK